MSGFYFLPFDLSRRPYEERCFRIHLLHQDQLPCEIMYDILKIYRIHTFTFLPASNIIIKKDKVPLQVECCR